jgi:hypothetical protein
MCQGQQARQRSIGSLAADNVPGRLRRSSSNVRSMETASVDQVASIWLLAAAIDRLVQHSVILEFKLPSYQMEGAKQSQAQK